MISRGLILTALLLATGCGVERSMTITSEPDGALVYLNDKEIGRTPVTRDFVWYGNYDVQLRKSGYEAVRTETMVMAPWWQWPPFDLFAELIPLPLSDRRTLHYAMQETTPEETSPDQLLSRAAELRSQLRPSRVP